MQGLCVQTPFVNRELTDCSCRAYLARVTGEGGLHEGAFQGDAMGRKASYLHAHACQRVECGKLL